MLVDESSSSAPALPVIADAGALWVVVAADVSPDELKPFVDAVWDIPGLMSGMSGAS